MGFSLSLFCDNNKAIAHTKEPKSHSKSKHIERQHHILREIVRIGDVAMQKITLADNFADPLAKPLSQAMLD